MSSTLRLVRVILLALLALAVPRLAFAQSVTIPATGYQRTNSDEKNASDRNNIPPEVITYDDCASDRGYSIVINTTGYDQSSELQLWAGVQDCSPVTARTGTNQQCWRVLPGAVPRVPSSTVNVKVRDILSYARTQGDYVKADAGVCAKAAQANVTLYYVFVKGGEPAGTPANKVFTVDTQGPPAPTDISAGAGEQLLVVGWKPSAENTDTQSYNVYCDDGSLVGDDASVGAADVSTTSPGPDASFDADVDADTEAGVDPEAGADAGADATTTTTADAATTTTTDAGSTGGGSCRSNGLVPGAIPPVSLVRCGTATGPAASAATVVEITKGVKLKNGATYAVAVSAVDQYGNAGPLSVLACGTPTQTDDFFDLYKRSGGSAGGCNEAGTGSASALAILVAATLASIFRRRRS